MMTGETCVYQSGTSAAHDGVRIFMRADGTVRFADTRNGVTQSVSVPPLAATFMYEALRDMMEGRA